MAAMSLPPFGAFPLWIAAFMIVQEIIYSRVPSALMALLAGWCFGGGYFIVGQYWTTPAFIELFRDHIWLSPVSLVIIPLVLGFLWGMAAMLAYSFRHNGPWFVLVYAAALSGVEYLRAQDLLFHYSWNNIGYTLYRLDGLLQAASLVGVYGLGFMVALLSSVPFLWLRRAEGKVYSAMAYGITAIVLMVMIWGELRLALPTSYKHETEIAVLQPNIPQFKKEERAYQEENLTILLEQISAVKSESKRSIVIFPETIFSIHRDANPEVYNRIGTALPENSMAAIGVRRFTPQETGGMEVRNSMVFFDGIGQVLATYDKHILSPWGEFIPSRNLLEKTVLNALIKGTKSLEAGVGPVTLRLPNMPAISPQICYEAAYPNYTMAGENRPDVIILASNDGLSGGTSQPYQSFLNVRVRAIETGIPVVRAANSGISAIMDGKGRVLQLLEMDEKGILQNALPLAENETVYARHKDLPLLIGLSLILAAAVLFRLLKAGRDRD